MQLTYPWFLLGLFAIGLPIAIHLLQLRRPQRMLFTNTAFIREVEMVTVRHRNIQHWLVLLARVLAVAALILVFCQPFIPSKETLVTQSGGVAVLIDNSFSMQVPDAATGSLLEGAIAEGHQMAASTNAGVSFRLLNEGTANLSRAIYENKLDGLRLSPQPIGDKIRAVSGRNEALYLFSDFQKNSFKTTDFQTIFEGREAVLVPLVGQRVANVYVDSIWLDDAFVRARTNVGLHVRLRNGGSVGVSDCPIKVFLGDRQVAAFRVTIGQGQAMVSTVQVQVSDERLSLGRVVTEDAPVVFDNIYYFTLQPAAAIRVLEIGAEPVAKEVYGNEPLFAYAFAKPQNIDYGILRQANLVIVRELSGVDAALREGLQSVVKRGGTVAVVPPAAGTSRASYQQLFRALGLGTAQWEEAAGVPELRSVAMPSPQEPFFRDVFGMQQRAVTMPQAAPVLRWARTGTDILRMQDGESYLASFASGAGRAYVFAAPFDKAYSDFTSQALFVPVMYRLAMLSYRNEQLPAYRLTQGTVAIQVPAAGAGGAEPADRAPFRLVKDSLTLVPGQRVVAQEARLELPVTMNAPGFYQVQQNGKVLTTLAFNPDKRESELAAYSAAELRQLVGPNQPNVQVLEGEDVGAQLAALQAAQTGQPLWRYFLAVVLLALLAEAVLVRWGKRQPTAKREPVAA